MNRRWFLGTLGGALVGASAAHGEPEPLIQKFSSVVVRKGGHVHSSLDVLKAVILKNPVTNFQASQGTLHRDWVGIRPSPNLHVNVRFPYHGQMSFLEDWEQPGSFFWRVGRLPIPAMMVNFIPADHPLGKWVRENNDNAFIAGRKAVGGATQFVFEHATLKALLDALERRT